MMSLIKFVTILAILLVLPVSVYATLGCSDIDFNNDGIITEEDHEPFLEYYNDNDLIVDYCQESFTDPWGAQDGVIGSVDYDCFIEKYQECLSPDFTCSYGNEPYGEIEITYTNENTINEAKIFAINPQKHPIIYPSGKLVLQLNSERCFEFTLVVKDSSGTEVGRYSDKPYSPYPDCDIPSGQSVDIDFLTMIIFDAPESHGRYTLEVYDDANTILTIGVIDILDPERTISSVSRTAWCAMDNSVYLLVLDAPYPIISGAGNPAKITVEIMGSDPSRSTQMFGQMSMSISPPPGYGGQISLSESGSPSCLDNVCRQDYSVTSTKSTSAIAYVWHDEGPNSRSAINSEGVTFLDLNKLQDIESKLSKIVTTSSEYIRYYNSVGDTEKAGIWQNAYDKSSVILAKIEALIPILESGNYKISNVVDLIEIVEDSPAIIDDIINSLSGA